MDDATSWKNAVNLFAEAKPDDPVAALCVGLLPLIEPLPKNRKTVRQIPARSCSRERGERTFLIKKESFITNE